MGDEQFLRKNHPNGTEKEWLRAWELRVANWSPQDIAQEMHCSVATVYVWAKKGEQYLALHEVYSRETEYHRASAAYDVLAMKLEEDLDRVELKEKIELAKVLIALAKARLGLLVWKHPSKQIMEYVNAEGAMPAPASSVDKAIEATLAERDDDGRV